MARNTKSTAAANAVTTSADEQSQDAVATSAASNPSGSTDPDGTNSTNTPPSSGDAAGEAPANPVKPQTNADHTEATTAEAANGTSTPDAEASASGDNSNASQGEVDGSGANAGSDQLIVELTYFMNQTGLAEFEQVVRVAEIGRRVISEIELIAKDIPDLAHRLTAENPAGIIRDLVAQVKVLEELLDTRTSASSPGEMRRFVITKNVRLNHVLHETGDLPWLTAEEHADAFAADACEPDWRNGGTRNQ